MKMKNHFKRGLSVLLVTVMMGLSFAACGEGTDNGEGAEGDADQIKIGFSISNRDQFLTSMEQAAVAKAEELGAICKVFDANNDVATQLSHVQTCAADNYSAMIVNLVTTDNAQEILGVAGEMPVVFVNRKPTESFLEKGKAMYVGSDENFSGGFQAEWVANYAKEQGLDTVRVVILQGVLGQEAAVTRTEAFKRELTQTHGVKMEVVYQDTAEWDRAKAMDKFVQFMGAGKEFDVVVCNNDEMALGVAEAMKTSGEKKILCPILGIDATAVGCQGVKDGDITFTVHQSSIGQGAGSVVSAIALATGTEIPAVEKATLNEEGTILWVDFEPVDINNVDEYMN